MIKALQERGKQLQAAKEALTKDLDEEQTEVDNLPTEYQSAKIDLQQAQPQLANNRDMIDDLNNRIERYRAQAKHVLINRQTDAAAAEKLENLQMEVQDQHTVINKLKDDNRKSMALFEQPHETDRKALKRKDTLLAKKDTYLAEKIEQLADKDAQLLEAAHALAEKEIEVEHLQGLLAGLHTQKSMDNNGAVTILDPLQDSYSSRRQKTLICCSAT